MIVALSLRQIQQLKELVLSEMDQCLTRNDKKGFQRCKKILLALDCPEQDTGWEPAPKEHQAAWDAQDVYLS